MEGKCSDCRMVGGTVKGYEVVANSKELKLILAQIFTDEFMVKNTNFECFETFKFSSAVIINWDSKTLIYSKVLLDTFVQESTRFDSWEEMVKTAADAKFGKLE